MTLKLIIITVKCVYGIEGKAKGSGLAVYFRNTLPFTKIKFLTVRNKYFESLGGKLKCDIGHVYIRPLPTGYPAKLLR